MTCTYCDADYHLRRGYCEYDLHGTVDWAKTSCAACEAEIPPNADRVADQFGNLYCSAECKAEGLSILIARVNGLPESGE